MNKQRGFNGSLIPSIASIESVLSVVAVLARTTTLGSVAHPDVSSPREGVPGASIAGVSEGSERSPSGA